eukprot:Blabericola_migrator_1__10216@NODE_570_length_7533_cov_212_053308_g425_i0_p6_GENE_NODE_570_length_7533_cov_212_053308_g425_i0NODE_570_length_7533_cov_212_053308_g425_i0_p6_ORF_typecomplete_len193_score35_56_NODE_570_length_7533_cov_212_053308_g425_i021792757
MLVWFAFLCLALADDLGRLKFRDLVELHERGLVPESIPLGMMSGTALNVLGSKALTIPFNRVYDGDWVFEAVNCTINDIREGDKESLGYLLMRGKRLAIARYEIHHEAGWKRGLVADFTQPVSRCEDKNGNPLPVSVSMFNPPPFNLIVDVWRIIPEHNVWLAQSYILLNKRGPRTWGFIAAVPNGEHTFAE